MNTATQSPPHALLPGPHETDIPPRLSDQCAAVAYQIQAHCLARGRDVGLSVDQLDALQAFRVAYDVMEARITMNQAIAAVLAEHQEALITAMAMRPALLYGTAWQRYRAASHAFGARLDATQAASRALQRRYLAFLTAVLAQLEREDV